MVCGGRRHEQHAAGKGQCGVPAQPADPGHRAAEDAVGPAGLLLDPCRPDAPRHLGRDGDTEHLADERGEAEGRERGVEAQTWAKMRWYSASFASQSIIVPVSAPVHRGEHG